MLNRVSAKPVLIEIFYQHTTAKMAGCDVNANMKLTTHRENMALTNGFCHHIAGQWHN
ncbi:Uncharacterised protein [Shigella sonnei]|nr:Uncharacterised protein [Shigella sonnei]CSP32937.1 Uncharacterised protein [Shigella sonnei]CSR61256.1 Uncharacterised protein [Shigella sonnei]CSS73295.1 Uncharacterised protein [Shigella sonnei]SRN42231.1 Uncharacterised protein [Shigella flexneri]